jgi:hypothetical protein
MELSIVNKGFNFAYFGKINLKTSLFFDTQNAPIVVAPTAWASSEHL